MKTLRSAHRELRKARGRRTTDDGERRRRSGMSLVELIVGVVVLTVGMLGLAGVSAVVLRQMRGGANQTIAATIAQTRFESLEGKPCASITSGSATQRGMTETWTVAPVGIRGMTVRDTVVFQGLNSKVKSKVGLTTVVSCTP